MDKSGFFPSLMEFIKANRAFFAMVLVIVLGVFGYFWWRAGFSLDISRFFAGQVGVLTVQCGATQNVLSWTPDDQANSNGVQRGNTGTKNLVGPCGDYWCWLPSDTYPHPAPPTTYTDTQLQTGMCYEYRIKYTPNLYSNSVYCPTGCNLPPATPTPSPTASPTLSPTLSPTPTGTCVPVPTCVYQGPPFCAFDPAPGTIYCPTPSPTPIPTLSPTATPQPVSCSAAVSQANTGEVITFTAQGGDGSYTWYAPGSAGAGTPFVGSDPFNTTYSTPGLKTVTVESGNNQGSCTATVNALVLPSPLVCSPKTQNVVEGNPATLSATGGAGTLSWTAPNGTSATNIGPNFTVVYPTPGSYTVTVRDQATPTNNTDTCAVNATCVIADCPAPQAGCSYQGGNQCACGTLVCPPNTLLTCAPANQTVAVGRTANFSVAGGTSNSFTWSAPGGVPSTGSGATGTFASTYNTPGNYTVTVTSGEQSARCAVSVPSPTPRSAPTPTPTPSSTPTTPALSLQKTVRNVTSNGTEADSTNANPGETVEFTIRVQSIGSAPANDVVLRDALPSGLTYAPGSTTIDSIPAADGIISTGLNLGSMSPGRTIIVRFRATVSSASFFNVGTTSEINTAYTQGSNAANQSDPAFVNVTRSGTGTTMTVSKRGRNITRNQQGESTSVKGSSGETISFIVHIQNTRLDAPLNNVMVRDVLPQGVTYVPGSAKLNGTTIPDTVMTGGYNIGSIAPGREAIVTYSGRIGPSSELPTGTTPLINTAQVSADDVTLTSAQLPVIIANLTTPTQVPTGPGESTVLAVIISAIVTLLYVGYTSTDAFRRREASGIARSDKKDPFDFRR